MNMDDPILPLTIRLAPDPAPVQPIDHPDTIACIHQWWLVLPANREMAEQIVDRDERWHANRVWERVRQRFTAERIDRGHRGG